MISKLPKVNVNVSMPECKPPKPRPRKYKTTAKDPANGKFLRQLMDEYGGSYDWWKGQIEQGVLQAKKISGKFFITNKAKKKWLDGCSVDPATMKTKHELAKGD